MYTICIVEDEERIARSVHDYLTRYGYQVHIAQDFLNVVEEIRELKPQLILLDINLPYQDGFHICRRVREFSTVPILFLTARNGQMEQVLGIESGGDDYVTKPFHLDVLHAKIKALLRRTYGEYGHAEPTRSHQLQIGALQLDMAAAEIAYQSETQSLTKNELKLLHLLIERAPGVVKREQCLEALWDDSSFVDDNTLTVNITRLRKKLQQWGLQEAIVTKRGMGYQLDKHKLEELA